MSNFDNCLDVVLKHEGGFVNHPKDPGGMTNLGITKKVYEAWMKKPVTEEQMRALTKQMVYPIYKAKYWDLMKCDSMPKGIDLMLFDFGVNAGQQRAIAKLQAAVGSYADGLIGPKTIAAVNQVEDKVALIKEYEQLRYDFYKSLSTYQHFGRGWDRRTKETAEKALEMLN